MGNAMLSAVLPKNLGPSTGIKVYLARPERLIALHSPIRLPQVYTMARDRSIPVPPPSPPASTGILRVSGNQIVAEDGKPVILRGAGLGGHLNMENFITGTFSSDTPSIVLRNFNRKVILVMSMKCDAL